MTCNGLPPVSARKRQRPDEDTADEGFARGLTAQKRYENTTACDQARQHNGDHYANVNIYQGSATAASAPRSLEPDAAEAALDRLMFDEMDARYLTINASLAPSSCRWLFDRQEYQRWQDVDLITEHHGFLWIKGKAGAGKSTLMKYAFDTAEKNRLNNHTVVSFFFNARGAPIERSLEGMYKALLYQILHKIPHLRHLLTKKRTLSPQTQDWSLSRLQSVFQDVVENLASERLTCYVDALDECTENDVEEMVSFFEDLGECSVAKGTQFYVCFASRHYPHISIERSESLVLEDQDGHKEDISKFVKKKLKISNKALKGEMSKQIEDRASGVFLWVVLVVSILNDECKRGNVQIIRTRLKDIPTGLTDLIQDILQRDKPTKYLVPLLQWVLYSRRPLAREELFLALQSIDTDTIQDSHTSEALTRDNIDKFILNTSKGLAEMTKGKTPRVQFIHELVRTHFLGAEGLVKLAPALRTNLLGQSHDLLTQCCYNYLVSETCTRSFLPRSLPKAESFEGKTLRNQTLVALPFLHYTVDNILYHANAAHAEGITQHNFDSSFPFVELTRWKNVLARYTSHRLTGAASKAYILAEQGCAALLDSIMKSLPQADSPGERCRSVLGAAVDSQDIRSVRAVLKQGGYEHSLGKDKAICMALAIDSDRLDIVQALVEAKAKPYNPRVIVPKHNALVLAASLPDKFSSNLGRFGLLRLVFSSLSDADFENSRCVAALDAAILEVCRLGDMDMFNLLWVKEATLSSEILRFACISGNEELVRCTWQVIHGERTMIDNRALAAASGAGHENIVRLLLHNGAEHYAEHGFGFDDCGLGRASANGHGPVVHLLLQHGASVDAVDPIIGLNALQIACAYGCTSIARLLVDSGAALNNRVGRVASNAMVSYTPLLVAISHRHPDIACLLIEEGADIHCVCLQGGTALWHACTWGDEMVAQLLIEKGADVNHRDSQGRTPLSVATQSGYTAVARLLVEHGAL